MFIYMGYCKKNLVFFQELNLSYKKYFYVKINNIYI